MKPTYPAHPLTIRRWFYGPRYPEGSNMIILASDGEWYMKKISGLVEKIGRHGAAYWLRVWRGKA